MRHDRVWDANPRLDHGVAERNGRDRRRPGGSGDVARLAGTLGTFGHRAYPDLPRRCGFDPA